MLKGIPFTNLANEILVHFKGLVYLKLSYHYNDN